MTLDGKNIWDAFVRGCLPDAGPEIEFERLHGDGSVTGAVSGSWHRGSGNRIIIDLGGENVFKGVLTRGWNETSQQFVVAFTAMSEAGISVWGSKVIQ